jgi:hypothetical protein
MGLKFVGMTALQIRQKIPILILVSEGYGASFEAARLRVKLAEYESAWIRNGSERTGCSDLSYFFCTG